MRRLDNKENLAPAPQFTDMSYSGFDFPTKSLKITRPVLSTEEAVERKMAYLQPKVLGKKLFTYTIKDMSKTYIPYHFFSYDFDLKRKIGLRRQGSISFIYDLNAEFPFYFDQKEDTLNLTTISYNDVKEQLTPIQGTYADAKLKCERMLQKRMYRFYRTDASSCMSEKWLFFRPAIKLDLVYKGINYVRYAYLDNNETSSEPINAMKLRIED